VTNGGSRPAHIASKLELRDDGSPELAVLSAFEWIRLGVPASTKKCSLAAVGTTMSFSSCAPPCTQYSKYSKSPRKPISFALVVMAMSSSRARAIRRSVS